MLIKLGPSMGVGHPHPATDGLSKVLPLLVSRYYCERTVALYKKQDEGSENEFD
jgi:hypothetical protein